MLFILQKSLVSRDVICYISERKPEGEDIMLDKGMLHSIFLLTSIAIFLIMGCGKKEEKAILARVDEEVITLTDFNDRISHLPAQYQEVVRKNKPRLLDDFIVESLLCKEAVRQGLDKLKDTKVVLREARRKILMARFIEEEVEKKVEVDEGELRDYYEKNKEKFRVAERFRASHILVRAEEKAQELRDKLSEGAIFEELAEAESIDLTNKRGGDLGYFTRGQFVPEFEEACIRLEIDEIGPVVKTAFGYHIIKLTDKQPSYVKEFESVEPDIEKELSSLKKRERFNHIVQDLRNKASIEVNYDLIKEEDKDEDQEQRQE